MKNILVPVDFSDASFNAVSYAAFLASAFNSSLLLLHVYSDTVAFEKNKKPEIFQSEAELDAANEKYLKKEIGRIAEQYTVKINVVVKKGNPSNVITEVAEKEHADFIVMGMKGKGESNSIFGSTTTSMINKTSLPIMVVPFSETQHNIDTITLASDFNDENLLNHFTVLQQFISSFDPLVQILHVRKTNSELTSELIADENKIGLQWEKCYHSFNIIENDNIQEGIHEFLEKNPSDLLIMVARKHNFIMNVLGISQTKKMTRQTNIPLLILHET